LFANEVEARALTGESSFEASVAALAQRTPIVCVTHGAQGSVIAANGAVHRIPAAPVDRVIDTTGAGDLYAAGVLYGITSGRDLPSAGWIGSVAAAEAISHVGPRPQQSLKALIG
jgi:sugar/nucleoside kinase (ribokinase family)